MNNDLTNLTYSTADNAVYVKTTSSTFSIPDFTFKDDNGQLIWSKLDIWWGWSTNHMIDLGGNYINFNNVTYDRIWMVTEKLHFRILVTII